MTKVPKLADPKHPAVRRALMITCPKCDAPPNRRCRALYYRIVHFARCEFRPPP
jgi:hypothetical protein